MKLVSIIVLVVGMVAFLSIGVVAQTNGASPSDTESRQHQIIGFLSKADQDRVIHAYNQAMQDNPALPKMQADLARDHATMQDASDADRQAFLARAKDYTTKLRAAMLTVDPQLGATLDQIDAHRRAMRAGAGQ